jgi:hypothetical protein
MTDLYAEIAELTIGNLLSDNKSDKPYYRSQIWQPDPRNAPQCLAYELAKSGAVMEMGYGGEPGGGKSDLILGLAATVYKSSLVLRREFPQLQQLIDRGNEFMPTTFVGGTKKRWEFDGHIIGLGSLQFDKDWRKYQGRARQMLAVDEAAEFGERGIRSVTGWNRTTDETLKTLVLFCFNPPTTPEGEWIIRYFAPWLDPQYPNPAESGEIRWMAHLPQESNTEKVIEVASGEPFDYNGTQIYPISRTFIRATRRDNPYNGEDYERRLQALPEPLRTILMNGDFTLSTQDDPWQVIPTNWVLEAQKRWAETKKPNVELRAIGNDVAHGGADNDVIARLYGVWFDDLLIYPGKATPNGETAAKYVQDVWDGYAPIGVDAVGYGASACDVMQSWGMSPLPINFGAGSHARDKSGRFEFFNMRAECYWRFRDALDPQSGENICLPPSRTLRADLCAPRYKIVRGKIQLEEKIKIKERLGRSPDEGDTVVLAWRAGQQMLTPVMLDW